MSEQSTSQKVETSPEGEGVITAAKQLTYGYKNTDFGIRTEEALGRGTLYTVVFKGEDSIWREIYVFVRGKRNYPYWTVREMLKDTSNGVFPRGYDLEFIKLIVVSVLTGLFAVTVVAIIYENQDNKSLQVLTGLLTTGFGYLFGRADTRSATKADRDNT